MAKVSKRRERISYIAAIIVVIIWVWVKLFYNPEESNKPKQKQEHYVPKAAAYNACKYFVKQRLKAPATAKFKSIYHTTINPIDPPANRKIKIISYVDAQNSFGAMIRTYFSCVIEKTDDGWQLDNLEFRE